MAFYGITSAYRTRSISDHVGRYWFKDQSETGASTYNWVTTCVVIDFDHNQTHRSTRSTGDLNREVRIEDGQNSAQAPNQGSTGPIESTNPVTGSLLKTRLQAALRLQEDGFAAIALSNSSEDLRRTQSNRESQQYPRLRRIRDAREAEQIKRDEELAKQISIADLGAAFRGAGR